MTIDDDFKKAINNERMNRLDGNRPDPTQTNYDKYGHRSNKDKPIPILETKFFKAGKEDLEHAENFQRDRKWANPEITAFAKQYVMESRITKGPRPLYELLTTSPEGKALIAEQREQLLKNQEARSFGPTEERDYGIKTPFPDEPRYGIREGDAPAVRRDKKMHFEHTEKMFILAKRLGWTPREEEFIP